MFNTPRSFYVFTHALLILGSVIAIYHKAWVALPALFASIGTLILSYHAYLDAKNKLRLELYEKRVKIYEELIKFCSEVLREANVNQAAIQAAQLSFRGLQYHTSKFLFGDDVNNYFGEINEAFAYLVSHTQAPPPQEHQEWVERRHFYLGEILKVIDDAPKLFRPYLYFGDIKSL